uniref:DUF4832 domain-containing protein n=1 Tax=Branchiostoma floridae TaxID=7739 RepID=C3Y2Z9_BRAFL|eukprot:XP_002609401.1 hypothetical protein BRAFLDRAFT_124622 [Branchiostoma floridae]
MKSSLLSLLAALVIVTAVDAYVDEYTDTLTGCECWFDSSRWDCACCRPGGCQCDASQPHRCIPCGGDCDDYPEFPWAIGNGMENVASSCDQCSISTGFVTKTYSPSDTDLTNPERGWWKYASTEASHFHILTVSQLRRYRSEGHTLIFRYYVLDLFVHSDISASFLTNLQDDLENARVAGVKIIPRFCYTETSGDSDDASLSRALRHLSQLKPYLQANGDVIAVVQAGFIGTWGEWYYSDSFSTPDSDGDPVVVTDNDWAKRHHNDCFLASDKDWGTFENLAEDYAYLSADTKYTVMGGETCNYNPPRTKTGTDIAVFPLHHDVVSRSRSSCAKAEEELALFHWSYLNPGYHPDVTDEWKQQGCFDRIGRHLGYRLELVSGTYRNAVPQGGTFCGRLEIRNVGYAAPFNPRQVRVVLQKDSAIVTSLVVTGVDPRDWHPGTLHSVPISVQLPSNLATGSYQVSLWLPDPSPTISDRPEFSILLANTGVPDPLTGLNSLGHTLEVLSRIQPL